MSEQAPNLTVSQSPTVGVTVRSGLQLLTGGFITEGIELFVYDFTENQAKWAAGAFTLLLVFIQNFLERRRNQKFIGAAPVPRIEGEHGHYDVPGVVVIVAISIVVWLAMYALVLK